MNFAIPRKNETDLLLYVWKIISLPVISEADLIYEISFKLFLDSPEKARLFVDKWINNNFLVKDDNENLSLSQNLKKKLKSWQIKRKIAIINKGGNRNDEIRENKNHILEDDSNHNTLLKAFLDILFIIPYILKPNLLTDYIFLLILLLCLVHVF